MARVRLFVGVVALLTIARPSTAQPLGTFRWQLSPYCNVLVLSVTQAGGTYRLEGYDDQCGAGLRAAVTGLAVTNPDGTMEFGLTIVTATSALPAHVDVTFTIAALGGSWRDHTGASGAFVFNPASPATGSPRPPAYAAIADGSVTNPKIAAGAVDAERVLDGAIGATEINSAEVQRRVTGVCATGQFVKSINADGTVVCGVDTGGAAGVISSITAGPGLSGGGSSGDVGLAVIFAGSGSAASAARSDHAHAGAGTITSVTAGSGLTGGGTAGAVNLDVLFAGTGVAVTSARSDHTHPGAGTITGVTAGTGLTGGGSTGAVNLNVAFAGSGVAPTSARSDHTHGGTGSGNTNIGDGSLIGLTSGTDNTALGFRALRSVLGGSGNTAVGIQALDANLAGGANVALGANALAANTASDNTAVGAGALDASVSGTANVAVGRDAMGANLAGSANVAIGASALALNGASSNLAAGFEAMAANTSGALNTAVGYRALRANTSAGNNVAVGANALGSNTASALNTAVGSSALAVHGGGTGNVAVGYGALANDTVSTGNTSLGVVALASLVSGDYNTAVGASALVLATSGQNVALGAGALSSLVNGTGNTALGSNALIGATGSANIAIGHNAGTNTSSGSGNIYLDHTGAGAESNTIRIGTSQTRAFVAGVSGQDTGVTGELLFVNSAGQLGTMNSSRRFKDDVRPLGDVRDQVQALRPVTFVYKPEFDDGSRLTQYGLIAEEVAAVLPDLAVPDGRGGVRTVRYHFLPTLLLAEVQRLERERAEQARLLTAQEREVQILREELAALRSVVDSLRTTPQ